MRTLKQLQVVVPALTQAGKLKEYFINCLNMI